MKLEAKIKMMNLQMITGGQKIEDTPQFRTALQEKQVMLEKDFEQKLQEIEKEREQIEDSKAQVEAYNKLLYKQRDIMNTLTSSLNEKEEKIASMQKTIEELNARLNENIQIIQSKSNHIEELEEILEKNKIPYEKVTEMNIGVSSMPTPTQRNKIYIPYEAEQNGNSDQLIPLLSSEEKIKELNDIVSYKEREITLLKKVSEKMFNNPSSPPSNMNEKIKSIEEENASLKSQLNEKNQMINLQRQENESLEEHYSAIEKMYHQTEKENLKLINIKENLISSLDNVIKKIDNSSYSETAFQSLRTDLVKVFQIVLDGNNANNNNDSEEEDGYEDRRRNGNANEVKRYQMAVNNNNMIKNIKITSIAHNKK